MNSIAHSENAKDFETQIGVDCYLPVFCDITNEDNEESYTKIREFGKSILEIILEDENDVITAMIEAGSGYLKKNRTSTDLRENLFLYTRALVYLRIYGIFWNKYSLNFFDPCLIKIPRDQAIVWENIQTQIDDLHNSLKGFHENYLKSEINKLDFREFRCLKCENRDLSAIKFYCNDCDNIGKVNLEKHKKQKQEKSIFLKYANTIVKKC